MREVHQIVGIPIAAWVLASMASGAAIVTGAGIAAAVERPPDGESVVEFVALVIPASLYIGIVVAILTALPWLALTWLMHGCGLKHRRISALLGGLMGAGLIQLFGFPLSEGVEGLPLTGLLFAAGLVGGLVYRVVAGRE